MDLIFILALEEGRVLDEIKVDPHFVELKVKTATTYRRCPLCKAASSQVHSHYSRKIADLPLSLKFTIIALKVKRFYCSGPTDALQFWSVKF